MNRNRHITETEILQYLSRSLSTADLNYWNAHLTECTECLDKVLRIQKISAQMHTELEMTPSTSLTLEMRQASLYRCDAKGANIVVHSLADHRGQPHIPQEGDHLYSVEMALKDTTLKIQPLVERAFCIHVQSLMYVIQTLEVRDRAQHAPVYITYPKKKYSTIPTLSVGMYQMRIETQLIEEYVDLELLWGDG